MAAHDMDRQVIDQFRAGGEIEGMHRDRLVLLTTRGRRTGRHRTSPMMFLPYHGDRLVIGSGDASTRDPAWVGNLRDDPLVHVEAPDGEYDATAEVLAGDERDAAWRVVLQHAPFFADHQSRVDRMIPVVRLRRA